MLSSTTSPSQEQRRPLIISKGEKKDQRFRHKCRAETISRLIIRHLSSRMSRPSWSNSWTSLDDPKASRRPSRGLNIAQCYETSEGSTQRSASSQRASRRYEPHLVIDAACHSHSHHQHLLQPARETPFMVDRLGDKTRQQQGQRGVSQYVR